MATEPNFIFSRNDAGSITVEFVSGVNPYDLEANGVTFNLGSYTAAMTVDDAVNGLASIQLTQLTLADNAPGLYDARITIAGSTPTLVPTYINSDQSTGDNGTYNNSIIIDVSTDDVCLANAGGGGGVPGAPGADGLGWTAGSYNAGTGIVTFTSDDGLGFVTGDLRGAPGSGSVDTVNGDAGPAVVLDGNDIETTTGSGTSLTTAIGNNTSLITGLVIDDLGDVDTTTAAPSLDEMLSWDGANWVPGLVGLSSFNANVSSIMNAFDGMTIDTPDITVTSNGTIVSLTCEKEGTGDIRVLFSSGVYNLDCTPIRSVSLTAGTDTSPQLNYVYIPETTKSITVSTTGFPTDVEYASLATVFVQSAASVQTDGALKVHVWTDHTSGAAEPGHIAHINEWIRTQPATWKSGAECTPSAGAGTLDVVINSGVVLQLHEQTFPSFNTSTGSSVYVVNDSETAYNKVGDLTLTSLPNDANGNALGAAGSDYYNLVLWGCVSQDSGDCKLFVNLPDGSYPSDTGSQAINDLDQTAVYEIPEAFRGCGFLIARLTVSIAGGTYTIEQNESLLGTFPSTSAGGGGGGGGARTLDELTDVAITAPTTGEILRYDGTNFVDATLALDDLASVDTTGVTTDQVLAYDGADWVPADNGVQNNVLGGDGGAAASVARLISLTQANYDAIVVKDTDCLYIVTDA